MPVAGLQVPTSWHWSGASQTTGGPPPRAPPSHVSALVQALPSSHAVPFGLAGLEQKPVAGLHVPMSWHSSWARQTTGTPGTQLPATHASPTVQASPSSQGVASAAAGFEQSPVDGSHVPASWHWSRAVQTTGTPGTQPPATQASP